MKRITLGLVTAAVAIAPVQAAAAAQSSNVTSPADGSSYVVNVLHPGTFAVAGTASNIAAVDLRCRDATGGGFTYSAVLGGGANIPVTGGTFTAAAVTLPTNQHPCQLVAVPTGTTPLEVSPFNGPTLRVLGYNLITVNGGPQNGKAYDFYAWVPGFDGAADFDSVGDCALDASYLLDPGPPPGYGQTGFNCNGYVPSNNANPLDSTKPALLVDNHPVYTPEAMGGDQIFISDHLAGYFPALTLGAAQNADGSSKLTDVESLARCAKGTAPDKFPPDASSCTGLADPGVALRVTNTVSGGGHVVRQVFDLLSTDKQAHQVDLTMVEAYSNPAGHEEFLFPGQAAYAQHSRGDAVTPVKGPATVYSRGAGRADGDYGAPRTALTYAVAPDSIQFFNGYEYLVRYKRSVPATGSLRITFIYSTEAWNVTVGADAAAAQASLYPTVAITSPSLDGVSTKRSTIRVAGVASDLDGAVGLAVNGKAVAVAANGTWATTISLKPGQNAVTALAVNGYGFTSSDRRTIKRLRTPRHHRHRRKR
jgi:hypothetical protein